MLRSQLLRFPPIIANKGPKVGHVPIYLVCRFGARRSLKIKRTKQTMIETLRTYRREAGGHG